MALVSPLLPRRINHVDRPAVELGQSRRGPEVVVRLFGERDESAVVVVDEGELPRGPEQPQVLASRLLRRDRSTWFGLRF